MPSAISAACVFAGLNRRFFADNDIRLGNSLEKSFRSVDFNDAIHYYEWRKDAYESVHQLNCVMNSKNFRIFLICVCLNVLGLSASAGVIGSLAFDSERFQVSTQGSDAHDSLPVVQENRDNTGMSTSSEIVRSDVPAGANSSLMNSGPGETGQLLLTLPLGFIPKSFPDPLLKVPISQDLDF